MIPMQREQVRPARSASLSRRHEPRRFVIDETDNEPALVAGIQLSQRQLELQSRRLGRQRSNSNIHQSPSLSSSSQLQQQRSGVVNDDHSSAHNMNGTTTRTRNHTGNPASAVVDNSNGSKRSFLARSNLGRKTSPKSEDSNNNNHNSNLLQRAAVVAAKHSGISPRGAAASSSTTTGSQHHRFSSRGVARPRPHSSPRGEQSSANSEDSDTARQYAIIRSFKSKSRNADTSAPKDKNGGSSSNMLQNLLKQALETSKAARPKDRRPIRVDPPATAISTQQAAVAAVSRQINAALVEPPPRHRTASSNIMEVREKEPRVTIPIEAYDTPSRTTVLPGKQCAEPDGAHAAQMADRNITNSKSDGERNGEETTIFAANVTENIDSRDDNYLHFVKQLSDEVSGSHTYLAASMKTAVTGIPQPVRVGKPMKMDEATRDRVSQMNKFLVSMNCDRANDKEKQAMNDRAYDRERKRLGNPQFSTDNLLTVPTKAHHRSSFVHPTRQPPLVDDRQSLPAPVPVPQKTSPIKQKSKQMMEPKPQKVAKPKPTWVEPKADEQTCPIEPPPPVIHDNAKETNSSDVDSASEAIQCEEPVRQATKPAKEPTTGPHVTEPLLLGKQRTIPMPLPLSTTGASDMKSVNSNKPLVLNKSLRSVKLPSPPSTPAAPEWMRVSLKPVRRDRSKPQLEEPISVPLATKLPGATAEHPIIVDAVTDIIPEAPIVSDKRPLVEIMDTRTITVEPTDQSHRALLPPKKKFADYPEDDTVLLLPLQQDKGYGESRILLGKQTIKNIKGGFDGKPMEDAIVNWSIDRNEIEPDGINLSMAIFCIILLLTNGEQVEILFQNSDDCVRFVSAFYDVTSVPPEVSDSTSVNSSVRGLESLNDEEQSVLERYRELRQTRPPMKALAETLAEDCNPPIATPGPLDARHGLLQQLLLQKSSSSDNEVTTTSDTDASKNGFPEVVSAPNLPSSPISTFTATSESLKCDLAALSDDEKAIAKKYDLMLKRGVPVEAVQHSLMKDGVDSKIVHFVLSETGASKVDDEEIERDKIIMKYKQMTKMGIPVEAVRHKMVKDGVDEPTLAIVLKALNVTEEVKGKNTPTILQSRKNILSPSEEIEVAKYRKLLKLQVSREALLSRMQNEKVSDKIIEAVLGKFALLQNKGKKLDDESTSSKLINLHWNPMDDVPAGSVWEQGQSSVDLEKSDISSLVEQFQKKPASSRQGPEPADRPNYTVKAKILDVTRANNVAISLKAFKDFSYKELAEIIGFLDPCRKILGERAQFIRDLLPTTQEAVIIAKYDGPDDRMGPAEQWFRRLEGIKRLETKAQVIRTMEFFSSEASEIRNNFRLLSQVCSQIQRSTKLVDVLKMVLKIGNTMNEGTRSGGAAGFRFDSLLRLTQTKTTDGKMSVLDYMVSVFVEKGQRDKLDLLSDFPELHTASRFLIVDMQNEVQTLGEALALCKAEHKAMTGDIITNPPELNKPEQAAVGDVKKALLESIVAQGDKAASLQKSEQFTKRDDFLAAIDTKRKASEDVTSDTGSRRTSNSRIENNFQGGMSRLRQFIDSVDDSFARLVKQKDEALECSRDLAKYCGEGGGVGATGSLLDILSKFTRNVESALRSFDERQVRLSTKKKVDVSRQSFDEHSTDTPHPDGRSLILMVNDVLKSANPSFKEDFKKGRKLPNPSDALKAIYEKEIALRSHDTNRESVGSSHYEENSCCSATLAVTASTEDSTLQSMSLHSPTNLVPSPTNTEVIGAAMEVIRSRAAIEESSLNKSGEVISNSISLSARALQKRQQRTMTTPTRNDEEALSEKTNPLESSTARLARMKRIQKRLGS